MEGLLGRFELTSLMDLHALEIAMTARRKEATEVPATPCRANREPVTRCKYGRILRPLDHGRTLKRKYELNRTMNRKYEQSFHKLSTQANCRRPEEKTKSKFRRCKMSMNLLYFFVTYFLLVCEAKNSVKGTRPRLIGEPRKKMVVTVGEPVLLKCAVEAEPPPLTAWKVNGKSIVGVRPGYKVGFNLRIRDVRPEDAGQYRCTATNAFGSVDYNINLNVRDPGEKVLKRPRFVMPAKMRKRTFSKPVNSFLRLRCRASGYPPPHIEWFKNGNLTTVPNYKSRRRQPWLYTFRKLQRNDSGIYRCRVWNSEGEIEYTYKINVIEQLRERPVLLAPHPMNTTVQVGGMTAIQCRVQSRVEPTVKWIKRLDDQAINAYGGTLPPSVITIEKHQYLILPTQEMLPMANGSYLNKLVIRGATEKHAGMYICLAANTMGYNFKYAYLTVVSGPVRNLSQGGSSIRSRNSLIRSTSQNKQASLSLPAIIGVPAGIGLVMVAFLAWFCHRRREQKLREETANVVMSSSDRLSALGSSETKSSTRSTPVPQDFEHHYTEDSTKNKDSLTGVAPQQITRSHEKYYPCTHRPPPTAGTPLLTVNEPDDSEFQVALTDDDIYCVPDAPPCSEAVSSCRSGTEGRLTFNIGVPPPPPPSQKSASSLSSYPDTRQQYSHHYHYLHPPGSSRRHHHHHHPRSGYHHYGY